jgi:hypothetical protein
LPSIGYGDGTGAIDDLRRKSYEIARAGARFTRDKKPAGGRLENRYLNDVTDANPNDGS